MNASGLWRGRCQGKIGNFKFINVEILPSREGRAIYPGVGPDARIAQSVTAREFKTAWAGGLGELSTGAMQARIGDTAAGSL